MGIVPKEGNCGVRVFLPVKNCTNTPSLIFKTINLQFNILSVYSCVKLVHVYVGSISKEFYKGDTDVF